MDNKSYVSSLKLGDEDSKIEFITFRIKKIAKDLRKFTITEINRSFKKKPSIKKFEDTDVE